jgi:hypothetical protein
VREFPTYGEKQLPDGREILVVPMTFGKARLTIGPAGAGWYEDGW